MAVDTLAKRLNESMVGGFTWSRRTVCLVLKDLAKLGVVRPSGYIKERGTRLRVLHRESLPVAQTAQLHKPGKRESCTPAAHESCTQELPKNLELKRYSDTGSAAKSAAAQPSMSFLKEKKQEKPKPEPFTDVDILNALTRYCGGPQLAEGLYWYIDERIDAAGAQPKYMRYWLKSAENLFRQYAQHMAIAMAVKWRFRPDARVHWNDQSEKWESGRYGHKTDQEHEAAYRAAQLQGAKLAKRLGASVSSYEQAPRESAAERRSREAHEQAKRVAAMLHALGHSRAPEPDLEVSPTVGPEEEEGGFRDLRDILREQEQGQDGYPRLTPPDAPEKKRGHCSACGEGFADRSAFDAHSCWAHRAYSTNAAGEERRAATEEVDDYPRLRPPESRNAPEVPA